MKWPTWILSGIALLLVIGGLAMVRRQSNTTPEEFFAAVEQRIAEGRYDREQTILILDQVLESAQASGATDLVARVQLRRGRTLMDLGAYERARADLLAVAEMRPTDPAVEDDLVQLEARSGDFHAALERVRRIVAREPAKSHGYVLLGRLHAQAADKALGQNRAVLTRVLVPESAAQAIALMQRSAALDQGDPQRVSIAHRLRGLLRLADEARLEEVLDSIDRATLDLTAAREAYATSLEHGIETEAVTGLVDLFERAGRTGLAVDLATVTVRMPSMRSSPEFARTLMRALRQLSRWRYAGELAAHWGLRTPPVSADFLAECCEVLWLSGRVAELGRAAQTLQAIGSTLQRDAAQLYIGLAITQYAAHETTLPVDATRAWQDGRHRLQLYVATEVPDPFPGARAEAWRRIALASRMLGDAQSERTALEGYITLVPEADGEAWLRVAELQLASPNSGFRVPAVRYAIGMSLLPERTAELLPRWHDIGGREMRAIGFDAEAVRSDLNQGRLWTPSSDASPYEYFRLAELHADARDGVRAGIYVRNVLLQVPGFVPALDLAIRVAGIQDKKRERMAVILERVERAGRTEAIDAILHETPLDELEPRDALALMRADPERSGRLMLANGLARRGRPAEALAMLSKVEPGSLGEDGRVLVASLHMAQREPARALEMISPMGAALFPLPGGIELAIRAALGAGDRARLVALSHVLARRIVQQVDEEGAIPAESWSIDRARALRIIDEMLAAGDGASALPMLEALDSTPRTRGGDVVVRLVACAVLRDKPDEASNALERARAFESRGEAEYAALLVAARAGRGEELRVLAGQLEMSGRAQSPLARAQTLLLQGRHTEARRMIDARLTGPTARDPWWNLTAAAADLLDPPQESDKQTAHVMPAWLGAQADAQAQVLFRGADGEGDPKPVLALLSAVRDPRGAPYARAWLAAAAPGSLGTLWPEWIRATLDHAQGFDAPTLEALARLRAAHPDFGPAWELEAEILDRRDRSEEARAEFRRQRDAALGAEGSTPSERLVDAARAERAAGTIDAALQSAREAVDADPWSIEARILVADLRSQTKNDLGALAILQEALTLGPPSDGRTWPLPRSSALDQAFVREYLAVLARLRADPAAPLARGRVESLLQALAAQRRGDPRVVLALAELDLDVDPRNPSVGLARAYNRLDSFRQSLKDESLESLAEGSVRDWARFYIERDPQRAQVFLEEELALDPTVISTWIETARAAEAAGDSRGALQQLELTARLAPRGDVLREILRLRSESELPAEAIEESVRRILGAEGRTGPDADLVLLQARCYLNLGPRFLGHVIEMLKALDPWRASSREFRVEHSVLSATAWMARGTPEDVVATRGVLEEMREEPDAYRRGYVRALWGMALAP